MDIAIIGSGNVATALGRKVLASGHTVKQVISRNASRGMALAAQLNAPYSAFPGPVDPEAAICIVAISDCALPLLHQQLQLGRMLVVHTAGSVSAQVLEPVSRNYGVLYPLQSFRAETAHVPPCPFLVDGHSPETLTMIADFAATLSDTVFHANDSYRKKIHLAAVAAGNFSNHIYALVQDYCKREAVDFTLLLPMLQEQLNNLGLYPAAARQTGPAIRNDVETLNLHLGMLSEYPGLSDIYQLFSTSIQRLHQSQKENAL